MYCNAMCVCVFELEIEMFMAGWKRAVVLSGTASTGLNLHSDANVENYQKRNHITMEVGWAPELLLQQLGTN